MGCKTFFLKCMSIVGLGLFFIIFTINYSFASDKNLALSFFKDVLSLSTASSDLAFYVGDINNDGLNELALSDRESKSVNVYNFTNGNLLLLSSIQFSEIPICIFSADSDSDGKNELLVGTGGDGYLYVGELINNEFNLEWKSPLLRSFHWNTEIGVGDVNDNGFNEIIVGVSWYGRYLISFEYNGSTYEQIFRSNIGSDVDSIQVYDVTGDGIEDLIVGTSCWNDYRLRIYSNYNLIFSSRRGETRVSCIDFDDDGIYEIIVGSGDICGCHYTNDPIVQVFKFMDGQFYNIFSSEKLTSNLAATFVASGTLNSEKVFVAGTWLNTHACGVIEKNYIRLYQNFKEVWVYPLEDLYETVFHIQIADVNNDFNNELIALTSKRLYIFSTENKQPTADAGEDQNVSIDNGCIATNISLDGSLSHDLDGDSLTYTWTWDNGSAYGEHPNINLPLGTHTVSLVVNDGILDSTADTVNITVIDETPPEISLSATPDIIWPPNHKMVPVIFTVNITDNCDPEPICHITSVFEDESVNGPFNGFAEPDWEITGDLKANLRAERKGNEKDRVYEIEVTCTDKFGNSSKETTNVTVPHDKGKE